MTHAFQLVFCLALTAISTYADDLLWDVAALSRAPQVEWGKTEGQIQKLSYAAEPWRGKPTRVFAYLGRPEGKGPFPAMVLVHGGGGKAFKDWAQHWAARGYVAIAMDLGGKGEDKADWEHGGPGQGHDHKFAPLTRAGAKDLWTYHAVANVLLAHSLVRSLPEVDKNRTGLTGISWGGYLTNIVAGIDHRFKVAVPVYGCGFLQDNSVWVGKGKNLDAYSPAERRLWVELYDPSSYVGGVRVPILYLNGTNDFAYPFDSYRKTIELVKPELATVAVQVNLKHGHYWIFKEVDVFVDSVIRGTRPLTKVGEVRTANDLASAPLEHVRGTLTGELHYTTDQGPWKPRKWQTLPARTTKGNITAELPKQRPLTFYLQVTDDRGLKTSSTYAEIATPPGEDNHALVPMPKLERDSYDWYQRHRQALLAKHSVNPEIIMIGDSITHFWGGQPHERRGNRGKDSWLGEHTLNLGFGWDRTQNLLWRINHGELDGIDPKLAVINIGTNNLAGTKNAKANTPAEIAEAIAVICERVKAKCPNAKIVLMGVFPRGRQATDGKRRQVAEINQLIRKLGDDPRITFIDLHDKFVSADGSIPKSLMPDALHPSAAGYAIWRQALEPHLP